MNAGAFPYLIVFRPEIRIVFSFASISSLFLLTPGSSTMATRSSPRWNMLIGGKLPTPGVMPLVQSLSRRESSARWMAKRALKVIMASPLAARLTKRADGPHRR